MFKLTSEFSVAQPLGQIFSFFSEAHNLQRITPKWLQFEVLTTGIKMRLGAVIDYKLRLRGIPIRWQSEITVWEPPFRFVDEQRRGPYRQWVHEHRFEERGERTWIRDQIRYQHFGGRPINRLIVAPDLRKIFEYREKRLTEIFREIRPIEKAQLAPNRPLQL